MTWACRAARARIQRELFFSALHLLAFALTCFIWFWTIQSILNPSRSLLAAVLIAIALGIVTEALQSLTLDRHASLIDLIANIAGALVATQSSFGSDAHLELPWPIGLAHDLSTRKISMSPN